jgi:hypothetical protein
MFTCLYDLAENICCNWYEILSLLSNAEASR